MTPRLSRLTQLNRRLDGVLNEFKAMDLGTKPGEGLCAEPYDPKAPYYPSIYINDQKESLDDIPAEGKAVIKYKVRSRTTSERNGVKKHSMSLDVLSIDPEASQKDDAKKKSEGKAVEMRTGVSALPSHEFSARPRDGDGQFVANVTGGADPVTMRQAYGPDPKKSKLLAPAAAAGALATAGLLGTSKGRMMAVTGAKRAARVVRSAVTGIDRKIKGRDARNYPVMGSKAKRSEGFGEYLQRQRMRGD